jgi:predicted RND superfamily exporter protein
MFGLVSGFGFLAMIGYKGCSLIYVIPYLLIGIGIDDMFIIYASFKYAYEHRKKKCEGSDEEIGDLIGETMLKSGVSITITSITDFVAFIVGLTTGFISVQIFCVYAAVSIGFCYFYQCTLFSGVLCLHTKRIEKKRNAILFCVEQKNLNCLSICVSNDLSNDEETMKPDNGELANLNDLNAIEKEKKSISKTKKSKNKNESPIKKVLKKIFKFLICTKLGNIYIYYFESPRNRIIIIAVKSWSK